VRSGSGVEKSRRLGIETNNAPPLVEQDQWVRDSRDDRLRRRKLVFNRAHALAPKPSRSFHREPNFLRQRGQAARGLSRKRVVGLVAERIRRVANYGEIADQTADEKRARHQGDGTDDQCGPWGDSAPHGKRSDGKQNGRRSGEPDSGSPMETCSPAPDHASAARIVPRGHPDRPAISGSRRGPKEPRG
jgi:hypothetical protein